MLYVELFDGFVNPAYHVTMWTVNVNRFLIMEFALYFGGFATGLIVLVLLYRYRTGKFKSHKEMLAKVLKDA